MVHNLHSIKKYTYNTVGLRRISFFSEIRNPRSVTTFLAQTPPPPPTKKCPCGAAPIGLLMYQRRFLLKQQRKRLGGKSSNEVYLNLKRKNHICVSLQVELQLMNSAAS